MAGRGGGEQEPGDVVRGAGAQLQVRAVDLHSQQGVGYGCENGAQLRFTAQTQPGRGHCGALSQRPYLVHRSLGDQAAAVDDDDAVGDVGGLLQIVGGEEDRPALRRLPPHHLPEGGAGGRVHAGGRLVQDQQLGLGQERQRQANALDLAAGALGDLPAEQPLQSGLGDHRFDVGYAQLEGGDDVEGLAHREGGVEPIGLEDRADASCPHRLPRGDAQDGGGAGVGAGEAEDDVEGGGLAGAVRSQEGDDLAGGDRQVQGVHGDDGAEGFAQTAHADGRLVGGRAGRAGRGACHDGGGGCAAHALSVAPTGFARY